MHDVSARPHATDELSRGRPPGLVGLKRALMLSTAILGVCACGSEETSTSLGARRWGDIDIAVEVRPSPPRPGHNEVVVILSGEHRRPVYDALVSLRARENGDWVQAIEDGHVGVYRRAVLFNNARDATLEVQLRREDAQTVVTFPVQLQQ